MLHFQSPPSSVSQKSRQTNPHQVPQREPLVSGTFFYMSLEFLNKSSPNKMKFHPSSTIPSTYPSDRYAFPFSVIPYIPFRSPIHPVHKNVGSDKYVINFARNKRFWLVYVGRRWMEINTTVCKEREREKPGASSSPPFLWPVCSRTSPLETDSSVI